MKKLDWAKLVLAVMMLAQLLWSFPCQTLIALVMVIAFMAGAIWSQQIHDWVWVRYFVWRWRHRHVGYRGRDVAERRYYSRIDR